jgi:hypothetical protein
MLGLTAGASFVAVDLVYVAQGRISRVYLGDAAAHGLLALLALKNRRGRRRATPPCGTRRGGPATNTTACCFVLSDSGTAAQDEG